MMPPLLPCPNCERHVRSTESRCPFCDADLAHAAASPILALPSGRLGSLALMTFRAAAFGAALTACGGNADDDDDGAKAGRAGAHAGTGGTSANPGNTGGTANGGRAGNGGTPLAGASFGGSPNDGGGVPIYRATPKG